MLTFLTYSPVDSKVKSLVLGTCVIDTHHFLLGETDKFKEGKEFVLGQIPR